MSELKLISPLLDNLAVGGPISDHNGIRCYPAMDETTKEKYIVKVISIPASRTKLDALLLSGAYADEASALVYFKETADDIIREVEALNQLSGLEGFVAYDKYQMVPMEDDIGFQLYLLGSYKRTLERQMSKQPMTYLSAINLGLDLCAALVTCRRSGYLYVDLKPGNICVTEDNGYRIGDIGFLHLNSLKFTSIPERYLSGYTAPEITDAFSELNSTLDVYAVGMILYQIFNNGDLPSLEDDGTLPAPANADYEMSEIIMKACSADPEQRWVDPAQMGQALVEYMQRNGANDTPIIPPAVPVVDTSADAEELPESDEELTEAEQIVETEDLQENLDPQDEELNSIAELLKDTDDETAPAFSEADINYDEVSDEINAILTQVDEIAEHEIPEPVVAPEPIDVQIPDSINTDESNEADDQIESSETEELTESSEAEASASETGEADTAEDTQATIVVPSTQEDSESETIAEETNETDNDITALPDGDCELTEDAEAKPKKKRHWVRNSILILLLLGLIAGGVLFYTNYYLLPISSFELEGCENTITVHVTAEEIDETLLTVICKDQHGKEYTAPLTNGQATFTGLAPNTGYNVTIRVTGFHKLTGDIVKTYSTPMETNVTQFIVKTAKDASAVIEFQISGRDSDAWSVVCSANGEEDKIIPAPDKTATVTGLVIGKEYTFQLQPDTPLYMTGIYKINYIATMPVIAQDLTVVSCQDNKMVVQWTAPKGAENTTWEVVCSDGASYNEKVSITDTTVEFEGVSNEAVYTITVTAEGMYNPASTAKPANAIFLKDVVFEENNRTAKFQWNTTEEMDGPWEVSYTVDGIQLEDPVKVDKRSFQIANLIPGGVYRITLKDSKGNSPTGSPYVFTAKQAEEFSGTFGSITIAKKDISAALCTPPNSTVWYHSGLTQDDYTNQFKVNQKAGLLLHIDGDSGKSRTKITRTYVVSDAYGNFISIAEDSNNWTNMWEDGNYCALTIEEMPEKAGEYQLLMFFDGQLVTVQPFTVID